MKASNPLGKTNKRNFNYIKFYVVVVFSFDRL